MEKRLQKIFISLLCIVILIQNINIGVANDSQTMQMTQFKNYKIEDNIYKLDFNDSLNINTGQGAWRFTDEDNAIIKDGKLYCKANSSFTIRSGLILGNEYALEDNPIIFNMLMEKGTVSVGVRLKSTVSTVDTGIWFHINNETIKITAGGTELNEEVKHNLSLNTERTYKIVNKDNRISLYISDKDKELLIAYVEYEYGENLTIKDSSNNILGNPVKNIRTPHVGFWKMTIDKLEGYLDNIQYTYNEITPNEYPESDQRIVDYSTWVATDDLNRVTPLNNETKNERKNKYVGLFYFLNHTNDREGVIHDVTKIYVEQGLDKLKEILPTTLGVYWAEPYFGYYLNTDTWVYRKHAYMFTAAGIDFIFLDFSNNIVYEKELITLLDTWLKIRKEGGQTPQIVCMTGDMPHVLIHDLYVLDKIMYSKPEYEQLFFKWDGKPLILGNNDNPDGDVWTVSEETIGDYSKDKMLSLLTNEEKQFYENGDFKKVLDNFTLRKSWARQSMKYKKDHKYAGYWDWLDEWPQSYGRNFKGKKEQMSVSIAATAMTHKGRSYIKGKIEYGTGLEDFDFTLGKAQYGLYFEEQFNQALKADPSVIMITGWNEWTAGKQTNNFENMRTGHTKTPYYHFVDQFNPEFSRDAEPMKLRDGVGFGDNFYYQMVSYIRRFKGIDPVPTSKETKGINFNINLPEGNEKLSKVDSEVMKDWDNVKTMYMDTVGDTTFRNFPSMGLQYHYLNATGRNDLEYAKVTQDSDNVYFLIKTFTGIVTEDESNWMNLYIDIDQNHKTGWEGYDYILNRSRGNKSVSIEKFVNNSWDFETIGSAEYLMGSDNLTIKVNKEMLGLRGSTLSFDFKWADNSTTSGDVMQFMDLGDSAPNDRFNFRFTTKEYRASFFTVKNIAITLAIFIIVIIFMCLIIKRNKKRKERKGI